MRVVVVVVVVFVVVVVVVGVAFHFISARFARFASSRGHLGSLAELRKDRPATAVCDRLDDVGVGNGGQPGRDVDRCLEGRLGGRLVYTRKEPTSVGRLMLGCRHEFRLAVGGGVFGAIEAVHLVVQVAHERNVEVKGGCRCGCGCG